MIIFSFHHLEPESFDFLACSVVIVCCPNERTDIVSIEHNHLASFEHTADLCLH